MNQIAALDISAEMARIHDAAWERAQAPVRTVLDDELAICVLRFELSLAEELLVAHGHGDGVRGQRQAFEQALAPALTAAVERATGRTVTSFLTATHLEACLTVLTFMFAPAAVPGT